MENGRANRNNPLERQKKRENFPGKKIFSRIFFIHLLIFYDLNKLDPQTQ